MDYTKKLSILKNSKFRSSFHLGDIEKEIIKKKGLGTIRVHAEEMLGKRIKNRPKNDGRQTPFKGHPVFVAQHATAICCRKCIEKWHHIPKDKPLTNEELTTFSSLIMAWLKNELNEEQKP